MQKAYKFRLYPTKAQEASFDTILELCRGTYNHFLSIWNKSDKIPSRYTLQAMLPRMKEDRGELKQVNSKTLQMVLFMLYNNLKALRERKKKGHKVGRLRYKKYGQYKSFILNQSGFKVIETDKRLNKLRISKVGDVPIRIHRMIQGKIKQVIVKQYNSGDWYALITTEYVPVPPPEQMTKVIGIDVGIKHFLSDSEGMQIENPKFYARTLAQIQIVQQRLSRMKKGSKNRRKQKKRLARLYQHLTNQRDDFLHKLSRYYVNTYNFISIEDLNIHGMVKNKHLGGRILDASWGKFFRLLECKAEIAGAFVSRVNPRGTSKEHKYGMEIDRDYNASINILERGLVGQGLPFMPSEVEPLRALIQVPASSIVEVGSPLR